MCFTASPFLKIVRTPCLNFALEGFAGAYENALKGVVLYFELLFRLSGKKYRHCFSLVEPEGCMMRSSGNNRRRLYTPILWDLTGSTCVDTGADGDFHKRKG